MHKSLLLQTMNLPALLNLSPLNFMTSVSIDNYLCISFKQQLNEQVAALKTKVKEQQEQITQLERLIQIMTQEIDEEKVYDC
jgi:uncharacterized alkaline shock family protein YloU